MGICCAPTTICELTRGLVPPTNPTDYSPSTVKSQRTLVSTSRKKVVGCRATGESYEGAVSCRTQDLSESIGGATGRV